jgi:prepilin-type N-terminal cleavage/methylation domain-containing protein
MFKLKKGFTLIELLVVISVIAVLAVAVLSSINPVEQINKAKDTASKSDASEILNAMERYYATFGCYPWEIVGGKCPSPYAYTSQASTAVGNLTASFTELVTKSEIKSQLQARISNQTNAGAKNNLILTGDANQLVHVCFLPSSKTFLGQANGIADGTTGNTHVCVP